jgi:hypothetical protein
MLHLLAVAAALGAPQIDLPELFAEQLPDVKAKTELTVLLPQRMPDLFEDYFPSGEGHKRRYTLDVGAAPNCFGATACFVADFSARKGGEPFGKRRVALARGRTGWFQPLSCGASCSPPSISWKERGATYDIQAKLAGGGRRALTRMANSAIRHGAR